MIKYKRGGTFCAFKSALFCPSFICGRGAVARLGGGGRPAQAGLETGGRDTRATVCQNVLEIAPPSYIRKNYTFNSILEIKKHRRS
jgi:hypothetical protein